MGALATLGASFLGKGGSSAGGMVKDLASGAANQRWAMKRQHDAQDFSAQQYASRYQTTVKDLKKAGLNPMLAYQQGAGSAPSGSPASGGGQVDLSKASNESKVASAQEGAISAQEENTRSDSGLKQQETKNLEKRNTLMDQELKNMVTTGEQMKKQMDQIDSNIKKNQAEIDNLKQLVKTGKASEKQLKSLALLQAEQSTLYQTQQALNSQSLNINKPTEAAAGLATGKGAAIARNVWSFFSPFGGK